MWTLRNRLVLVNMVVVLLTFVVLAGALSGQLLGHLYGQLDSELAALSQQALREVEFSDGRLHNGEWEEHALVVPGYPGFVRLLDEQGRILGGMGEFQNLAVAPRALSAPDAGMALNERTKDGRLLRVYTQPFLAQVHEDGGRGGRVGYIQTARVPEEVLEIGEQIRRSLFIALPLALIVVGLAGFLATRRALAPLTTMTLNAAAIGADSLSAHRLPVPQTRDEVQALALAINATLDRLAAAFARQRRFTADASHELRTPVTAILGQAELALTRTRTPEGYQETLRRIKSEAERMQRLIGRMLALARAEAGQQVQVFAPTDVAALLDTLAETLAPEVEAKGISLQVQAPSTAIVVTDADSLTQILLNLLQNAITHTERGTVDVALERRADGYRIQVSDSGPGIDAQHLELVFEPFHRADPSRQGGSGHIGLGLALAQELAHLLGGRLEAANRPEGGAVFTLTLPLEPPASPRSSRPDAG